MDDWQTLRNYVDHNSDEAFAALMARYLGLVYSVCRRELTDDQSAEDVTQAVFLLLARKAPTLRRGVILSGWLFQTARYAAKNARLQAQRRAAYEQKAAEEMLSQSEMEDAAWAEIEPVLNQSLAALRPADRDCVLLRFFQGLTFAEVGTALGLSEEAARKRVTRALDKMRHFFGKNGVIVPGAALAVLLSAHAAKAAPAHLSGAAAHILAGSVPAHITLITEGVLHAMKIAQMKAFACVAALVLVGTAATYGVVRGADHAAKTAEPFYVTMPALISPALMQKITADSTKPTQYRPVALTGRVLHSDGMPAGGVRVSAELQITFLVKLSRQGFSPEAVAAKTMSFTHTQPDGTYTLCVGEGMAYNILVVPKDVVKVGDRDSGLAAAVEGISGTKGATVRVPDLTLTPGGLITGTVTDPSGRPLAGVPIGCYGPQRPLSCAAIVSTRTDAQGHYRLRVAPGQNLVFPAYDLGAIDSATVRGIKIGGTMKVAEGETVDDSFNLLLHARVQ